MEKRLEYISASLAFKLIREGRKDIYREDIRGNRDRLALGGMFYFEDIVNAKWLIEI